MQEHIPERSSEEEPIKSIQYAAVPWQDRPRILHPRSSFERGLKKVSDLRCDTDDNPKDGSHDRRQPEHRTNSGAQNPSDEQPCDCPFPALPRANARGQLVASEARSDEVSGDIIGPD